MADCVGCHHPIAEGQHFMRVRIELDTAMPANWQPAQEGEPTVFDLVAHRPECLQRWALNNEILEDVFYR